MARQTLPDTVPQASRLRRIASSTPVVLAVYAAGTLMLGLDTVNPLVAAVGVTATGAGFIAGNIGVRKATTHLEGLL